MVPIFEKKNSFTKEIGENLLYANSQNSTQPDMHIVLVLPFISTIVLLANTLNCIDPLVAAYSNLQDHPLTSEDSFLGSRVYNQHVIACGA